MEKLTVRKPNGTIYRLRMFGDGPTRMTSEGVVFLQDGVWVWQTDRPRNLEIVNDP